MKTLVVDLVLVILSLSVGAISSYAGGPEPTLLEQLRLLKDSVTGEYEDMRYVILQHEGLIERLERIRENTDDWHIKMLCDVLIYHKKNPEKAVLLERKWGRELKYPIWIGRQSPRMEYSGVVRHHFGPDAAPVVAEKVLHTWVFESYQTLESAIYTLYWLRYEYLPDVLIEALNERLLSSYPSLVAATVVGLSLQGLAEREAVLTDPETGTCLFPRELERFRQDRVALPALRFEGKRRDEVLRKVASLLTHHYTSVQARTAYALRCEPTTAVVAMLKDRLLLDVTDDSEAEWIIRWRLNRGTKIDSEDGQREMAWVRAWCADSLREIGTPEALEALESARRSEKHPEVLEVIEGRRKPRWYWKGDAPVGSILNPVARHAHER